MDHLGIALRRIRLRLSPRQIVVCFRGTTFLSFSQTTAVRFLRSDRFLPSLLLSFSERWRKKSQRRKILLCSTFPVILFFSRKWRIAKENINRRGTYHDKGEEEDEAITRDASRRRREKRAHTFAAKKWVVNSRRWSHATRAASLLFPSLSLATLLLARHREESRLSFSLFSSFSSFLLFSTDHRRPSSSRPRVEPRPTPISIARARLGL